MLLLQSTLWSLCLVQLRTTCNSHCTDREKASWLYATNNSNNANCQSVMFLLTVAQSLCIPTGANCTMPLDLFPSVLSNHGHTVCALYVVWGAGSLWRILTVSLVCWAIEPGSISVLLIEEASGQPQCNDEPIRWGRVLVRAAGPKRKRLRVTYSITQWSWLLDNFVTPDSRRSREGFMCGRIRREWKTDPHRHLFDCANQHISKISKTVLKLITLVFLL